VKNDQIFLAKSVSSAVANWKFFTFYLFNTSMPGHLLLALSTFAAISSGDGGIKHTTNLTGMLTF